MLLIAGLLTLLLAVALGSYVTQSITVPLAELGQAPRHWRAAIFSTKSMLVEMTNWAS